MCDLRRPFLKAILGVAVPGGELVYGWRTGVRRRLGAAYGVVTRSRDAGPRGWRARP